MTRHISLSQLQQLLIKIEQWLLWYRESRSEIDTVATIYWQVHWPWNKYKWTYLSLLLLLIPVLHRTKTRDYSKQTHTASCAISFTTFLLQMLWEDIGCVTTEPGVGVDYTAGVTVRSSVHLDHVSTEGVPAAAPAHCQCRDRHIWDERHCRRSIGLCRTTS